ncbi:MAG: iron-sulfur cluster assembly accessory protein [Candidatus Eisenbacteria bacterium]|nr:iron-sulfur cluster assembly accessory protein [Candidatus Eisenbacteria bacterium]
MSQDTMMLNITEEAARAARETIEKDGHSCEETFIRIGVRAGGCSGFSYALGFETVEREDDARLEAGGVRFVIDSRSRDLLQGATLDFTSGLQGTGFTFRNPNAASSCGCGQSFNV